MIFTNLGPGLLSQGMIIEKVEFHGESVLKKLSLH